MAKESYEDLIFQLGDLAREHLAQATNVPPEMDAVFDAEDEVLACRAALAEAEAALNEEAHRWDDFLTACADEKSKHKRVVAQWRSAVAGVESRSRDLKKKLSSLAAGYRYRQASLKRADAAHRELELREGHDARKIELSRENLKRSRIHLMREKRVIDELEAEFDHVLTPRPGQLGAEGILAHRRLLELEDEMAQEQEHHQENVKVLEAMAAEKESLTKDAEQALDEALFALGEACYAARMVHSVLQPLYARLDKT